MKRLKSISYRVIFLIWTFLYISNLNGYNQVGDWESFLSHHKIIQAEKDNNDNPVVLTEGGIVIYDIYTGNHQIIQKSDVLKKINFTVLHIDPYNKIWLGGESPNGIIQLVDPELKSVQYTYDFELLQITEIVSDSANTFAVYSNQNETGILHFIRNNNCWDYKDYYRSFPIELTEIIDAIIINGQILLCTNTGILSGDTSENLKISSNWNLLLNTSEAIGVLHNNVPSFYSNSEIYLLEESGVQTIIIPESLGNPIELKKLDGQYLVLNESTFGILNNDGLLINEFENPFTSGFVSIIDENMIAIELHGIIEIEQSKLNPPPNTPIQSQFSAITILENGDIASIGKKGLSILKNDQWFNLFPSNLDYTFDPAFFGNYPLNYKLSSGANGSIFPSWSIVQSGENKVIFGNTGITPLPNSPKGALIEADFNSLQVEQYDTTNGILGGLNGIFNHGWSSAYMVVNQIKTDSHGNIWVLNPHEEINDNIIAIRPYQSETWYHIAAPDEFSYLPTELDFDSAGRTWVAFESRRSMENELYSSGGLKVVRIIGGFEEPLNYVWYDLVNPDILPNENVWSLTIDEQDFVWALTSGGIQGYFFDFSLSGVELAEIYPLDFYTYLPFYLGDHIRSDSQNTKWITTRHSGVKTILESTQFWPDVDGFTSSNSGLLSDVVYDVYLDEENGSAWFTTELGISKLNMPVSKKTESNAELQFSPNPFKVTENQHLIIEGCAPGSTVIIQSVGGKYVNTLYAEYQQQPSTQVLWNGRDSHGTIVPSGIYIASSRIAGEKSKIGKFALIRQ